MKRILKFVLPVIFSVLLFSCSKTTDEMLLPLSVTGKNRFTTMIDGDEREYYVNVPPGYNANNPTAVVFMLHGTSGDGEKFYENSGWKEIGRDENIITVFPSSWRYCIFAGGVQKNTTKWNTPPDAEWYFCAGQRPRNDIKFLSTVIDELHAKYNIDSKRIYLAGFSNGGQMAAKCAVELSDKLAAVVECASSFYLDTTYIPKRKLPVLFQIGNEDYGPGNTGQAIPLDTLDYLISTPGLTFKGGSFYKIANTHLKTFGLNPNFIIGGDANSVTYATYKSTTPGSNNEFVYALIKGLGHTYPNGENHWMEGARVHWEWFKQYSLP